MSEHTLASILVGDHLGQVKKVLWPSGEVSLVGDLSEPDKSNPVVSIVPLETHEGGADHTTHLIATKLGHMYIHESITGKTRPSPIKGEDSLLKAFVFGCHGSVLVYEKYIDIRMHTQDPIFKLKKGHIRNASKHDHLLAVVGKDIPLRVLDVETKKWIFEAELPDKDYLGLQPECEVVGLDFVGKTRVATSSKSDSVIRVYDLETGGKKSKPIITVDINQTAFLEHAEAGRFMSVASSGDEGHSIVVGSNVGQQLAIDLRFHVKKLHPKKRLQPKTSKILGGFKGSRGATIKDIKMVPASEDNVSYKVISCCLDRYLRIHNFSKTSRVLDKHVYMKTKPLCCAPVLYEGV